MSYDYFLSDGNVSVLKAAYVEPTEVCALATSLGCVAFDAQKGSFLAD